MFPIPVVGFIFTETLDHCTQVVVAVFLPRATEKECVFIGIIRTPLFVFITQVSYFQRHKSVPITLSCRRIELILPFKRKVAVEENIWSNNALIFARKSISVERIISAFVVIGRVGNMFARLVFGFPPLAGSKLAEHLTAIIGKRIKFSLGFRARKPNDIFYIRLNTGLLEVAWNSIFSLQILVSNRTYIVVVNEEIEEIAYSRRSQFAGERLYLVKPTEPVKSVRIKYLCFGIVALMEFPTIHIVFDIYIFNTKISCTAIIPALFICGIGVPRYGSASVHISGQPTGCITFNRMRHSVESRPVGFAFRINHNLRIISP